MTHPSTPVGRAFVASALAVGALLIVAGPSFAGEPAAKSTSETPSRQITFTKDIAPIFQERCQECHRPGSIAPMSLLTYEETRPWAKSIRQRVIQRQMPPWHIDPSVGVQKFKNDISLTSDQINTIAHWVDSGAPKGDPKDMPPPKQFPAANEWKAAKELGQPDLVIKSEPYTMAAHHQDVWWRPVSNIAITEPRWVRAVEMRPGTAAGRRITHHAVAYLVQDDDPDSNGPDARADLGGRAQLMEWAVGKGYDLYRPDTGKLLLPGSQISWDVHIHAVGEEIRDNVELGIWFYPKGQEPRYRTYLTGFQALRGFDNSRGSHSAELCGRHRQLHGAEASRHYREFPASHASARQSHAGGGDLAGRNGPNHQLRRQFQFQLDDELYLRRRRRAGAAQRHHHPCHGLVR